MGAISKYCVLKLAVFGIPVILIWANFFLQSLLASELRKGETKDENSSTSFVVDNHPFIIATLYQT